MIRRLPFVVLIHINAFACVPCYGVAAPVSDERCWRLVAAADVIVLARIDRDAIVGGPNAQSDWVYTDLTLRVSRVLKGRVPEEAGSIRFRYSDRVDREFVAEKPKDLIDKEVLAFLVQGWRDPTNLYVARTPIRGTCVGLMPADRSVADSIAQEVKEQTVLADSSVRDCARDSAVVRRLIAGLRRARSQDKSIADLMKLGPAEVPALIKHLGDATPLAKRSMAVPMSPSHFEAASVNTPETVTDVLATVLQHITGESFGTLANGGSAPTRKRVIRGWQVYLQKQCAVNASHARALGVNETC